MYVRPDRPLVVKCTFDRWNKHISFASAKNCSYDLLKSKIEQCFSLYATPYVLAYKDDDGEVTDITTESDLTEAIQYFQAGSDDPPLSSAASILSGRSFGSKRRITLRVHITVEYDGPSLSDTSSLASLEDYGGRNKSNGELSWTGSALSGDLDDDSVTVSSRDTYGRHEDQDTNPAEGSQQRDLVDPEGPFSDRYQSSAAERYPADPDTVFATLKIREEADALSDRNYARSSPFEKSLSLSARDRGAAWLRDQKARTIKAMLGATPEPSESDSQSVSISSSDDQESQGNVDGDLALQRDPRGKYYYSYTGGSSSTHDSGYEDESSVKDENEPSASSSSGHIRPNSMQLSWLASQRKPQDDDVGGSSSSASSSWVQVPFALAPDIPPEVLQFLPQIGPPPGTLTTCSECGVLLDAIRYVCAMCGEKQPVGHLVPNGMNLGMSKGKERSLDPAHQILSSSPSPSPMGSTIWSTYSQGRGECVQNKPLPSLPPSSSPTLYSSRRSDPENSGYELCSGCIEAAGIYHALPASNTGPEPTSPEDAMSLWRRSAPRKGQLRHAYFEKVWGHHGWDDVEQEAMQTSKCSTCNSTIIGRRYKCASCPKFNLCRACYSQVHDIHPTHAFLVVMDKPVKSRGEAEYLPAMVTTQDGNEEQPMKHPGVKCTHCLQDILGARFHCAICDSVDICSNCESAGLPGNLDSSDGGHLSSHIMIKIPYPLETHEVQTASRRAINLWTGRDAANVLTASHSKPSSVYSSYAQTVVGSRMRFLTQDDPPEEHGIICDGCKETIFGTRYQCATCPSIPNTYSLCASCEERSYIFHDPMHSFFKLPRRVHRPLQSSSGFLPKLYKVPVGPVGGLAPLADPKEYLSFLLHSTALCDRCLDRIHGPWFRCAYCAKDLCGDCEALDTHDETHLFVVFKAPVDMPQFRQFANLERPAPIIPFPVYDANQWNNSR